MSSGVVTVSSRNRRLDDIVSVLEAEVRVHHSLTRTPFTFRRRAHLLGGHLEESAAVIAIITSGACGAHDCR
jgi:hypothetical protein